MNTRNRTHVVITLTVAADQLYKTRNPKRRDLDSCCSLSDNNNGSQGNRTIHYFQSDVYANYTVRWVGVVKDPNGQDQGYTIAITGIRNKSKKIFANLKLKGTRGKFGTVCETAKHDIGNKKDTYTITFKIYPPNTRSIKKELRIDPKLQGNN